MIRKMQKEDIQAVVGLEKEIFSTPWSEKSFADALLSEDNIYLVEESQERICGYCGIWISYDTADLCNMAVSPSCRRQGIGERLLQEMIHLAVMHNVKRILLEVRQSNLPAYELYQKKGFQEIGIRKNYYRSPAEDAVLMACEIGNMYNCKSAEK